MIDLRTRLDALSDDDRLVQDAARDYAGRDPELKRVRALRDQRPSHDPQAWRTLAEMGWLGVAIPEEHGGLGLGRLELCVLAEEIGRRHEAAIIHRSLTTFGRQRFKSAQRRFDAS